MKTFKKYLAWALATVAAACTFTACQDDVDAPQLEVPVASLQPNTTIAELKEAFWNDAANYADTIGLRPDGQHYIIAGRVISTDEPGNVFKSITIQDKTGCISFSINSYNLYLNYRRGQEVVIDATGMFIGKYAGLQQFGLPSFYQNGNTWQVGFMPPELFKRHAELNGMPDLAEIDTLVVDNFAKLSTTPDGLRYWQSRLVRFNNVHFADGGVRDFSVYKSNNNDDVNRNLIDANGDNIVVRTSGYADFATKRLPEGSGDVVGILGFYENLGGATTWQLTLIDYEGCMNFGNPTIAPGTQNNPMSVAMAIEAENNGENRSAWIKGYIVGAVAPEVSSVKSDADVEWTANPVLDNTLVIADNADVKSIANAIVIPLPYGSKLRQFGNLVDNPGNYGKEIVIQGTLDKYLDTYGLIDNPGTPATWQIEGVTTGGETIADGNGVKETPFSPSQVINGTASGTAWVCGYIIGSSNGMNGSDMNVGAVDPSASNIFIAATPDETDYKKCVPVQLPTGTVRAALNLQNNPGNVGLKVSVLGSIEKYFGQPGVKTVTDYVLDGQATPPTPPAVSGSGTENDPYTVASVLAINPQSTTDTDYKGVWVKGYIVGWADMSTEYYINANTARFATPATLATNILVAATPTANDYAQCIGVQLPSGTVRAALNLMDNPGNLGKEVMLKGDILKYSGVPGLRNTSDYKLDGSGTPPTPPVTTDPVTSVDQNFDAATTIPAGWSQIQIAGDKAWYVPTYQNNNYAAMTGYKGTAPFDSWLMTPPVDIDKCTDKTLTFDTQVNGYASTTTVFEVYALNDPDPAKATVKTKLNPAIATAPSSGYSAWQASGNVSLASFSGIIYIGFRYYATADANYATWCVDNVKINAGGDDPTPPTPPTPPAGEYKGDFDSFNGGVAKSSPYGEYKNESGWIARNSIVLGGSDGDDANPYFAFIGKKGVLAPTLNGKASAPGSLTSPLLAGGIGTLSFSYGFAFKDTACSFRVTVKDADGNVLKTQDVALTSIEQKKAYGFSMDVNYAGSFTVEIVNLAVSAKEANTDRVSIWNLTWSDIK